MRWLLTVVGPGSSMWGIRATLPPPFFGGNWQYGTAVGLRYPAKLESDTHANQPKTDQTTDRACHPAASSWDGRPFLLSFAVHATAIRNVAAKNKRKAPNHRDSPEFPFSSWPLSLVPRFKHSIVDGREHCGIFFLWDLLPTAYSFVSWPMPLYHKQREYEASSIYLPPPPKHGAAGGKRKHQAAAARQ